MNVRNFIKTLGPGLLYAGAAVGVSHLVQSTRAGASFGFDLVWILIIANIIKYPFFEFGPRYAVASGNDLIKGYYNTGKWAIILFGLITILTMFAIQAAITIVTAGLVAHVFNLQINTTLLCGLFLGASMIILIIGKYSLLDKTIKFIIIILALSTIVALIFAFNIDQSPSLAKPAGFSWANPVNLAFIIAFIGWMPAPIDVSVWHSLWSIAKRKQLRYTPSLSQSLTDFRIGYIGTALLALGFLTLGALVMHNSGKVLSSNGVMFAGQLINMYTIPLGKWAYWVISIAALATMFSTTLTCLDAYPRVLKPTTKYMFKALREQKRDYAWLDYSWLIILVTGTLLLLSILATSMRFMVDLATTISFVTAPFFAIMNYKVVTAKHMPSEGKPKKWLKIYAIAGIFILSIFTLFYLIWKTGLLNQA